VQCGLKTKGIPPHGTFTKHRTPHRDYIRRHPHVFGDETARNAGMAKGAWDKIKAQEKAEKAHRREQQSMPEEQPSNSLLDDVPAAMPGLMAAVKLQQKASKVGFDWNDPKKVLEKIREELQETEVEIDRNDKDAIKDEIGDILFAVANLARHMDIDPDQALRSSNQKFRKRFSYIEANISHENTTMEAASLETMEMLWVKSKSI